MRLIDADALCKAMYHEAFETDTPLQRWDSGCWIRYRMFSDAVENAPTIEPERKTGRWLREEKHCKYSEYDFHYYEEHCSVCGVRRRIGWMVANYCPNCGAKMEDEV